MSRYRTKGATAVELVIYVAVLSLLLGVFFALMFSLFQTFSQVRATRATITAAQTALERVVRETRSAVDVDTSSDFLSDPATLVLDRVDDSEITFGVSNGRLEVSVDGEDPEPLTPSGISVESFTVVDHQNSRSRALSIGVEFLGTRGSGLSTPFQTTVVLRGSYEQ